MSEDMQKEVEITTQTSSEVASTEQGVETLQSIAPGIDYEAQSNALVEELARVEQEKENYKRAALKAKGKLPDDQEDQGNDLEALIEKKVEEKFILSRETQLRKQQEELIQKALRENKELKRALQAKSQVSNMSMGSAGSSTQEVSDGVLSKDQIQTLKSKGWDDAKIQKFKENLSKKR